MDERIRIVKRGLNHRTIKRKCAKAFDGWVQSLPDELRLLVVQNSVITGGAIASMLLGDPVNDFDIYFKTSDVAFAVACHYVKQLRMIRAIKDRPFKRMCAVRTKDDRISIRISSAGVASSDAAPDNYDYFEQDGAKNPADFIEEICEPVSYTGLTPRHRPVFVTSNAITLENKIQLCFRFTGEVEELHKNYDFIHCMCSWNSKTGELTLPVDSLVSLMSRELIYKHSRYPLCSLFRTRKFLSRGWYINASQYVKMAFDLNKLDLQDHRVLKDQLIGVDTALFMEVIRKLDHDNPVDSTYLFQLLDEVFDGIEYERGRAVAD